MTAQREEWRRLADAATPGHWVAQSSDDGASDPWWIDTHAYEDGPEPVWAPPQYPVSAADAAFIAAAREAVPSLLAQLDALQKASDDLRNDEMSDLEHYHLDSRFHEFARRVRSILTPDSTGARE